MKRATRPQIHAYGLAMLLLLLTVALTVALAMLGHATMSGGPQWSAGSLAGVIVALAIAVVVTIAVGIAAVGEWVARGRRQTPEPNAGLWFVEPEDAPYEPSAFWAETAACAAVREADEAVVDALAMRRAHHRRNRAGQRTLTHHGR